MFKRLNVKHTKSLITIFTTAKPKHFVISILVFTHITLECKNKIYYFVTLENSCMYYCLLPYLPGR